MREDDDDSDAHRGRIDGVLLAEEGERGGRQGKKGKVK